MPRLSAIATEAAEHALAPAPLPAPDGLTPEEVTLWRGLADAGGLDAGNGPVLRELIAAMSRSRRVNSALEAMGGKSLTGSSKAGKEARAVYLQLAAASVAEARLISVLSTKLRLSKQARTRSVIAERERERRATGPRPWDTAERSN